MKRIKTYVTVVLMLLSLPVIAQTIANNPSRIEDKLHPKRLFVGDTVDLNAYEWNSVRNYPAGKIKLSDFKGKYIILDIWNKQCSSCIAAFPKMQELQNQFEGELQVLLVTMNSEKELSLLLKNSPNVKNTKLPMIMGDSILTNELFPHRSVPYHVWLDRSGKVIATTNSAETNSKNLKDLIGGKKLNLIVRNDLFEQDLLEEIHNKKISLLKVGGGRFKDHLKYYAEIPTKKIGNKGPSLTSAVPDLPYYSMFTSYLGDIMKGYDKLESSKLLDKDGNAKGFRIKSYSIASFYTQAYNVENNIKIIVEDSAKQLFEEITDTTNLKRHLINNTYCYESCLPNYTFESARELLRQDLARFLGMSGSVEERPIKHLILTRLGNSKEESLWAKNQNSVKESIESGKRKEGYVIKNRDIGYIYTSLKLQNKMVDDPIIVDETGFDPSKKIDVLLECTSLHATEENLPIIRKALAKYGLGLREENRVVKVMVLRTAF